MALMGSQENAENGHGSRLSHVHGNIDAGPSMSNGNKTKIDRVDIKLRVGISDMIKTEDYRMDYVPDMYLSQSGDEEAQDDPSMEQKPNHLNASSATITNESIGKISQQLKTFHDFGIYLISEAAKLMMTCANVASDEHANNIHDKFNEFLSTTANDFKALTDSIAPENPNFNPIPDLEDSTDDGTTDSLLEANSQRSARECSPPVTLRSDEEEDDLLVLVSEKSESKQQDCNDDSEMSSAPTPQSSESTQEIKFSRLMAQKRKSKNAELFPEESDDDGDGRKLPEISFIDDSDRSPVKLINIADHTKINF